MAATTRKKPLAEPYLYPRMLKRPKPRDSVLPEFPIYRFTVRQFVEMVAAGILGKDDRVELYDGWVVPKYSQTPLHAYACNELREQLMLALGKNWWPRGRHALVVRQSVFEPDMAVVRDHPPTANRWPTAQNAKLVAEVSDIELLRDRDYKLSRYAAAGIPTYWIVNLIDRRVEVYAEPVAGRRPCYRVRRDYANDEEVPVVLDGKVATSIRSSALIPVKDGAKRQ